jgi:hypothetical protein
MKNLRALIVLALGKLLGVPVKLRDSYYGAKYGVRDCS